MPDYDLFRPHADDLEHAVSKRLRLRDGVNFTIGTTQVHMGRKIWRPFSERFNNYRIRNASKYWRPSRTCWKT